MIYFIQKSTGEVKIGYSETLSGVGRRLSALQVANHVHLELIAVFRGDREHERLLHEIHARHRLDGEWFEPAVLHDYGICIADGILRNAHHKSGNFGTLDKNERVHHMCDLDELNRVEAMTVAVFPQSVREAAQS